MVDSQYRTENYKFLKINIETKNVEIIRFVLDYLKIKRLHKYAVKKLPHVIGLVPDQYKIQEICDKGATENGGTLKFVLTTMKIKNCVMKLLMIM